MKLNQSDSDFVNSLDVRLQLPGVRPDLFVGEADTLANHPGTVETTWTLRDGSEFKQTAPILVTVVNSRPWLFSFKN
jgi:hypothetical protein